VFGLSEYEKEDRVSVMDDFMNENNENAAENYSGFRGFKLNEFEGPLDLLLFLIKKNEKNIFDYPIAKITEQYLDYLGNAAELDLDEASEFYGLAATLLLIKSRMLLPVEMDADDTDEDPRQELVERLIEYQKYKKLSGLMGEKATEAEWVIERKRLQQPLPFDDESLWEQVDAWELLKIFSELNRSLSGERLIDLYEEITINEKIVLLLEILEKKGECRFTDLLIRTDSILDFVCAFLALLEVAKQHMVLVFQNRMFGDIIIRSNEKVCNDRSGISESNGVD
jgi:segregation and condensation protein A